MDTQILQRLVDESDIRDVIHRYALSVDRKRWDELSSCFSGQIEADFTAAGIREVFTGPSEQWIDGIKLSNNGMDATLHTLSNVRIRVNGDQATASCAFYVVNILANPAGTATTRSAASTISNSSAWSMSGVSPGTSGPCRYVPEIPTFSNSPTHGLPRPARRRVSPEQPVHEDRSSTGRSYRHQRGRNRHGPGSRLAPG
jgi:hypothetical protein